MVKIVESRSDYFVFGSLASDLDSFMLGQEKDHKGHGSAEEKLLHKGDDFKLIFGTEDSKFIFGNVEGDSFLAKNDYLWVSDYLCAKHDSLLAAADLQSKSLQ
jgi:hypothetical protein